MSSVRHTANQMSPEMMSLFVQPISLLLAQADTSFVNVGVVNPVSSNSGSSS